MNEALLFTWRLTPDSVSFLYQANATGRSAKTVREFLEKQYSPENVATLDLSVKMAVRALLEVVQSGAKNVEVAIMEDKKPMRVSRLGKSLAFSVWNVRVYASI